jgi:hypothetical protein
VASISGLVRRLRGFGSLPVQVAELRAKVDQMHSVLMTLNHEVHSGSEQALPLFVGYAERLRLDADTAIGAAQVIERQLAELENTIAALRSNG